METVIAENCLQTGAGVKVLGKKERKKQTNSSGVADEEFERLGTCDFSIFRLGIKQTSVKYFPKDYCGVIFCYDTVSI